MDILASWMHELWSLMAPTTWLLLLGLLVSYTFVKKALG